MHRGYNEVYLVRHFRVKHCTKLLFLILELQFNLHQFKCMFVTAALHIFLQLGMKTIIKQIW